ncbi:hypothetical protein NW768_002479 [Fusarium equiseti]|uniref:Heterokaryon incompatibility domain-containing protein n=1 Tax=Fusarium equiseti TaxID=61235 RepID=A0ABQ8RNQ8_FUSEQ|nr:hypothetical protein NW768_002479 [Fusarium equiseti]
MSSQLCDVCTKLNIEDLVSDQGFALHPDILQLHTSAQSCQLCYQAVERICSGDSKLKYSDENEKYLASRQARVFFHRQRPYRKQGLTIVISDVSSQTPGNGAEYPWLPMRVLDGDPAREFGVDTVRLVPQNSSSLLSTIRALKWLKECLLSEGLYDNCWHVFNHKLHEDIADAISTNPEVQRLKLSEDVKLLYKKRVPAQSYNQDRAGRLIEIIGTDKLRLVEGSAQCSPYVALSYRWGGLDPVWQTTTKNLDRRQDEFSINDLPKTLSDAVNVTRDLGFRWIWIDSLCIVQDNKDDWAREAVKMASIYQNAIVTIAADSSQDAKAGLHNEKSTSTFKTEDRTDICNTLSTGDESTLYLIPNRETRRDESITSFRDMGDLLVTARYETVAGRCKSGFFRHASFIMLLISSTGSATTVSKKVKTNFVG